MKYTDHRLYHMLRQTGFLLLFSIFTIDSLHAHAGEDHSKDVKQPSALQQALTLSTPVTMTPSASGTGVSSMGTGYGGATASGSAQGSCGADSAGTQIDVSDYLQSGFDYVSELLHFADVLQLSDDQVKALNRSAQSMQKKAFSSAEMLADSLYFIDDASTELEDVLELVAQLELLRADIYAAGISGIANAKNILNGTQRLRAQQLISAQGETEPQENPLAVKAVASTTPIQIVQETGIAPKDDLCGIDELNGLNAMMRTVGLTSWPQVDFDTLKLDDDAVTAGLNQVPGGLGSGQDFVVISHQLYQILVRNQQQLGLEDTQVKDLDDLDMETRKKAIRLRAEIQVARLDMEPLEQLRFTNQSLNFEQIQEAVVRMRELQDEVNQVGLETFRAMMALLNAQQKVLLAGRN